MSKLTVGAVLVAVWVLMWGSASPANLASGVAVAVALFVVYPTNMPMWPVRPIRPWRVAVLLGRFAVDLVVSNFWLSLTVIVPRSSVRTALVWVDLQFDDPALITMVANLTALTPGTVVVRIAHHDDGRPTVQVHCLSVRDPELAARSVAGLEARCVRAVGTAAQVAALRPVGPDCGICDGPEDPLERERLT